MSHAEAHPLAPWVVILAGVVGAAHVGKLPPAVPVLQDELGISLVQLGSVLGQFSGPPLVAWVASRVDGRHWTWVVTSACCCVGAALALMVRLQLRDGHSLAPAD